MAPLALVLLCVVCAVMAIQAHRLLTAVLWLAMTSALLSVLFFQLGAYELAVIELSVGSGLITVLLFLTISATGDQTLRLRPLIPRWLTLGLTLLALSLIATRTLPETIHEITTVTGPSFSELLWESRWLDLMLQIALMHVGLIASLGLIRQTKGERRISRVEPETRPALLEEAF